MLGSSNKPLPCLVEPLPVEADLLHLLAFDPLDFAPSRFAFVSQVFKPKQSDGTIDLEDLHRPSYWEWLRSSPE